ncbi:hypothetical protein [Bradyrhizobium sp. USDA 4452]
MSVRSPSGPDDPGKVAHGYYTVQGSVLTMTDADGKPLGARARLEVMRR